MPAIAFIEKAFEGCDLLELKTCEDCGKQYYLKVNHIFGKNAFERKKNAGYPVVVPLEDGCECERDDDEEDD